MVTTYFKNLVAEHIWHITGASPLPGEYYLALSSTQPLEDGTGVTEPDAAAGYTRVAMSGLSKANAGVVSNTTAISWPKTTMNSGTISYWALYDASANGNPLMGGALDDLKHLDKGATISIPVGKFSLKVLGEQLG